MALSEKRVIDCMGMQCPAPILHIARAVKEIGSRPAVLEVVVDDADFPSDVNAWCRTSKHQLLDMRQDGAVFVARIGLNGGVVVAEATGEPESGPQRVAKPLVQPPTAAATGTASAPIDLRGLRAPEPIRQLSGVLFASPGARVVASSDDPGFMADVVAWASATKVTLLSVQHGADSTVVELVLGEVPAASAGAIAQRPVPAAVAPVIPQPARVGALSVATDDNVAPARENRCTILVLKNDFESLMAALLCATTAAAQGMESVMYFSFWGVNLLRGERPRKNVAVQRVSILQKMMQWMMPRGPARQKMSKMHMGGMGLGMMEYFMRKNNVMNLAELMDAAVEQKVQFVVCSMSMGIMGIQKRDIMDLPNVEFAGVTTFVEMSRRSSMSLVF
jgi:peroxiredoxin family protein/TusA-related sulfurtransferase